MRTRIEVNPKEIARIIKIINGHLNDEIRINDLLLELLRIKVSSSDYLFILLSKLQKIGLVEGRRGILKIKGVIDNELSHSLIEKINREVSKMKILVTPLEVAKFYQCPRRFYLEKVVLSRQFKKERGRVWDGEVLHLAVQMFINNLSKGNVDELMAKIPKTTLKKYAGKITITEKDVRDFLMKLYRLTKDEKFDFLVSERTLLSIKNGLRGTPDLIARNESGEFIPIDVKLGKIDRRGIKKEHMLQNTGEAILVEDFLRTKIDKSCLIYFRSDSVIQTELKRDIKKEFISLKRELERMSKKGVIPPMSKLPNARARVCRGCHVKPSCDNIEELSGMGR